MFEKTKLQNQKSLAKQQSRTAAEMAKLRETQQALFLQRIPPEATEEEIKLVVRSIVEGDARSFAESDPEIGNVAERRRKLLDQQTALKGQLEQLEPRYKNALTARDEVLKLEQRWDQMGIRDRIPRPEGSRGLFWIVAVLIAVVEAFLLFPAFDTLIREQIPSLNDFSVKVLAILAVVVLTGASEVVLTLAGKERKIFETREVLNEIINTEDGLKEDGRRLFSKPAKPGSYQGMVALGAFLQLILFFIRFKGVTIPDDQTKTVVIGASLFVALFSVALFFLERKLYDSSSELPSTYSNADIERFVTMRDRKEVVIPREIRHLDAQLLGIELANLRLHQSYASTLDAKVRAAVNSLVDETTKKLSELGSTETEQ